MPWHGSPRPVTHMDTASPHEIKEIAAVLEAIIRHEPAMDDETLKRRLLDLYERTRLTSSASTYLDRCIGLTR